MAQTKSSQSGRSGSSAKKTGSSARSTGTTKKSASSPGNRAAEKPSRSRSDAQGGAARGRANEPARRARNEGASREIGALVLLLVGITALISWFPADGWLVGAYRSFFKGTLGWGYFLTPVTFLWGMAVLWLVREQPVRKRLTCILLLPLVFGAFVHVVAFNRESLFASGIGYGFRQLWLVSQDVEEHCGGVIAGILGFLLKKSLSRIGASIVLVLVFLLMTLHALNTTVLELWELIRDRYLMINDEDEEDDDEAGYEPAEVPEPVFVREEPKPGTTKKQARSADAAPQKEAAAKAAPRRRMYDENWEQQKDQIFAVMGVDKHAELRVAAVLKEEKDARRNAKKKAPAAERTKQTDLSGVEPLSVEEAAGIAGVEIHSADMDQGAAGPAVKKEKIDRNTEAAAVAEEIAAAEDEKPAYIFPDVALLNKSDPKMQERANAEDENEQRLESAIRSFGVGATITGAIHGPTVTRYELRLDQGVKLSKITNLQNDIALSIGVSSVRIAPIPNKISTVGVEVPNREKTTVWLGDVIDSDAFKNAKSRLSVAMGKDIGGNVIVGNIAKMPHVLIAGTTGSGKSVCINSLILSLLYKSTPDEVRMIMVDPKQVELGIYNGMPHLYVPVVTDAKKAAGALQWSVVEMLKRYRLFSEVGVRDIAGYNAVLTANEQPILPQVVIIIDELADLMMVAAKEVEESICRVAQMGRAAGMHLVVATQSPRADVITGLMKANIPSRVAFAVSSALESRIILDQQGAEKLVGQGDMLYSPIGIGKPLRVQGAFVTDEEREEIINFVKREAEAEYSDEILAEIERAAVKEDKKNGKAEEEEEHGKNDYDELLPQAVDVIFETKQASVSMLQRRLKLGYSRAARLIDQLEEVGVVGPYEGSKPRQILLTKQQWQEMQYSQGTAPVDTIAQEFAAVSENDTFAAAEDEEDERLPEAEDDAAWDGEDDDI